MHSNLGLLVGFLAVFMGFTEGIRKDSDVRSRENREVSIVT